MIRLVPARPSLLAGLVLPGLLLASGCSSEEKQPPKQQQPARSQPPRTEQPKAQAQPKAQPRPRAQARPRAQPRPKAQARPRVRPAKRASLPPLRARVQPRPRPRRRPPSVLSQAKGKYQIGDVLEVSLRRGGVVRGELMRISDRTLTLTSSRKRGAPLVTSLRANQVKRLRLVRRPLDGLKTSISNTPRYPEESWLPAFSDGQVLGRKATPLWAKRFEANRPLLVSRTFHLPALRYTHRSKRSYFERMLRPAEIQRGERIKVCGTTLAYRGARGKRAEECLGPAYIYLVRGKGEARLVVSRAALPVSELEPSSVKRFLSEEPVTCIVTRPRARWPHKVRRISASHARLYRRHLDLTPDRLTLRALRAKRSKDLISEAEARVREVYRAVGLPRDKDLQSPLILKLTLPAAVEGGIHLLPYQREVGMD